MTQQTPEPYRQINTGYYATPGPWSVQFVDGPGTKFGTVTRSTATVKTKRSSTAYPETVATVRAGHVTRKAFESRWDYSGPAMRARAVDANARLIDLCPAMMEALTDLVAWYDSDAGDLGSLMDVARNILMEVDGKAVTPER